VQVNLLDHMLKLVVALAPVQEFRLSAHSREEGRIDDEKRTLVSALRQAESAYEGAISKLSPEKQFAPAGSDLGKTICPDFMAALALFAKRAHSEITKVWVDDLVALKDAVLSWVPEGWQAAQSELLQEANKEVLAALLNNPNYKTLSAAAPLLVKMSTNLQIMSRDGAGPVVDANTLKAVGLRRPLPSLRVIGKVSVASEVAFGEIVLGS